MARRCNAIRYLGNSQFRENQLSISHHNILEEHSVTPSLFETNVCKHIVMVTGSLYEIEREIERMRDRELFPRIMSIECKNHMLESRHTKQESPTGEMRQFLGKESAHCAARRNICHKCERQITGDYQNRRFERIQMAVRSTVYVTGERRAHKEYQRIIRWCKPSDDPGFTRAFTADELDVGITALKKGKAPGLDDIQAELIKQLGPRARDWLLRFFNSCTASKKIPKL